MKRYAVMGAGLMGRVVAKDLIETEPDTAVTLIDFNAALLEDAAAFIDNPRLSVERVDVGETDRTAKVLEGCRAVVAALPHRRSMDGLTAAIAARAPIVDLVGSHPERRQQLDGRAQDAGILVVPGCGVAPGLSNVLVTRGVEMLDQVREAVIYVGGLPRLKAPPLEYQTVYSLESVFNSCVRPARIWRDGHEVIVEPLSGIELLQFPEPIGKLEAFYTDGLASLMLTMTDRITESLVEKTLRYPGFADRVRLLRDCGLLDTEPVHVGSVEIVPRDLLVRQLAPMLELGPDGDLVVMRVTVKGSVDGAERSHTFDLVDYFDPLTSYTAMARTTGFTGAAAARMIGAGRIPQTGVRFPEQVFVGSLGAEFLTALGEHGIAIAHSEDG
ncbi:MAG: saccharopine dehydrogenase family protein [Gemmatimonadales bacterium]